MASTVFPISTTTTLNTNTATVPVANTLYKTTIALAAGIYTVTCPSATIARVQFMSNSTLIVEAVTVSGTVTVNVSSAATIVQYFINTGSDVSVSISLVGNSIAAGAAPSGTLDTLTTSGTYTQTGTGYVVVVGAGGGGGSGGQSQSGQGGYSGGINFGTAILTGSISYTIGAAGAAKGDTGLVRGNDGGTTTFSAATAISATGGGGGNGGQGGSGGTAGSPNGAAGGSATGTATPYTFVKAGTTGGGGGGRQNGGGAGSGIGTGGAGSPNTNGAAGSNASGYGAGGGGGADTNYGGGGAGSPGVIYVLRY